MVVPARVSLVTLGVADVERSTAFYRALGWQLSPASVAGEVSFFHTDGGLLALWDLAALATETGQTMDTAPGGGFRHTMLALNLDSPEEVDAVLEEVVAAGARAVKDAKLGLVSGFGMINFDRGLGSGAAVLAGTAKT